MGLKFLISGGGTGGHIFPAIAIANELKRRYPDCVILFVGAQDKMEMQKVPAAGYAIKGLWISGFHRGLEVRNLVFPIKLIVSWFKANAIVKKFNPHCAIGTGGFASGLAINAALNRHVPVILQEQNSYLGVTNKLLSKRATKICVAYNGMEHFFPSHKVIKTGNPVRQNIILCHVKSEKARADFEISATAKVILIVGGSLGSRTLNNCMINALRQITDAHIHVIWQTGALSFDACKHAAKDYSAIHVYDFIANIDHAYAAADIIISRAGAIAISELCIVGKPIILVPLPSAAEDHQTKNAKALVDANAALSVTDAHAAATLIETAIQLMSDEQKRTLLSQNIKQFAIPDAAERIVDEIDQLMEIKIHGLKK